MGIGNFLKGKTYQKVYFIEKYNKISFEINSYVICALCFMCVIGIVNNMRLLYYLYDNN